MQRRILEQHKKYMLINDFALENEWKKLYVDEHTDYSIKSDVHLQT